MRKRSEKMKRREFFISDLHLDHKNIIRYCNRPFRSVGGMNRFIVGSWNRTVGKSDTVYFLGDMCYGRRNKGIDYWVARLNGAIVFIRGYHDRSSEVRFHDSLILKRGGERLLLVHDPMNAPLGWDGWVVHGHTHNNRPEYPLISLERRTINVSAELLDYKPISIKKILDLIAQARTRNRGNRKILNLPFLRTCA